MIKAKTAPRGARTRTTPAGALIWLMAAWLAGCAPAARQDAATVVTVSVPRERSAVNILIYGEMLEDCNDSIIYGGVVNADGSPRPRVDALVRALDIPVVRWPGGTYSKEYHWENAVGPIDRRPVTEDYAWRGKDNNRFGTDEFLRWCREVGTQAYINFNMGNQSPYAGTLQEAIHWIDYVNGPATTPYGARRAAAGHPEPYGVRYWGIGNENYGPWGRHDAEADTVYADKLYRWASAIGDRYPDLRLLAVGHHYRWDSVVLERCGGLVDLLTQHYYVTSHIRDGKPETPERSLFAPRKMEEHLQMLAPLVKAANQHFQREDDPLTLSVDEWDNRHSVYDSGRYRFTRQDPRYQFDVAVVAGMLNVFIRQSPLVGMANYIFPVNGHGLIRSVGDTGAYRAAIYYVFDRYRRWMCGDRLNVSVAGPGKNARDIDFYIDGDASEVRGDSAHLPYIDAASVMSADSILTVAVVNCRADSSEPFSLRLPEGYVATRRWRLENADISAYNSAEARDRVKPETEAVDAYRGNYTGTVAPCGLQLIRCQRLR